MTAAVEAPKKVNTAKKTYTLEEFMALPLKNGKRYELVEGELRDMDGRSGIHSKMTRPSGIHSRIVRKLIRYLDTYLDSHPVGKAFPGAAFVLDPTRKKNARVPDVGFITAARLEDLDLSSAIPVPPDLAIEVISPSEVVLDIEAKILAYQRAGVKLIWSIYLDGRYALVHRLGEPDIRILNMRDELDGEDVIPGFKLPVKVLYE